MKKKILSFALMAVALLGAGTANAQTSDKARSIVPPDSIQKEIYETQMFDGIQLTNAQKAGLKAFDVQRYQDRQAKREAIRAEKQRQDSLKNEARQQDRRDYLEGVKNILTPDQYVVFLENIVVEGPDIMKGAKMQKAKGAKFDKQKKGKKDGRDKGARRVKYSKDDRQRRR